MSSYTELTNWRIDLGHDNLFVTTEEVKWELGAKGSGLWLIAPKGYKFDVSIPRYLWWLLNPKDERFLKAACLHDYALDKLKWDRVTSAAAFSEALRATGVSRTTRLAMVLAVITWKWR